jgi:hypothetical protein
LATAARHPHDPRNRRDPERDDDVAQGRPEDRGHADRDDEEREREDDIAEARDDGVPPAAEVAGDKADRHGDDHREQRGEDAGLERRAGAVDDAREHVAPEVVGAHDVAPRRPLEHRAEVRVGRVVRRDERGEQRDEDEQRRDGEAANRHRPAAEAAQRATARPDARGDGDVDRAHRDGSRRGLPQTTVEQ